MPIEQASASAGGSDTCTLPGDIPGLLRRGSPGVLSREIASSMHGKIDVGARVTVTAITGVDVCLAHVVDHHRGYHPAFQIAFKDAALDLTDATGRAHAAWWLIGQCSVTDARACGLTMVELEGIRGAATHGFKMSPASVDALRRVCLHVAGRA